MLYGYLQDIGLYISCEILMKPQIGDIWISTASNNYFSYIRGYPQCLWRISSEYLIPIIFRMGRERERKRERERERGRENNRYNIYYIISIYIYNNINKYNII